MGRILGFLGVMPRPMLFNGQLIKAAPSSQFIVAPESRSVGVMLLRAFFEGPQDLSLTDEANSISRKLWEKIGGTILGKDPHARGVNSTSSLGVCAELLRRCEGFRSVL